MQSDEREAGQPTASEAVGADGTEETFQFNDFPDELILMIFVELTPYQICRVLSVCKRWLSLGSDRIVWRQMCRVHFPHMFGPLGLPESALFDGDIDWFSMFRGYARSAPAPVSGAKKDRAKFLPAPRVATGAAADDTRSRSLRIDHLPLTADEADVRALASVYGYVVRVHLPLDRLSYARRGFGFVSFMFPYERDAAARELNGVEWRGQRLVVTAT